jgi:hypothetical protein
MTSTGRRRRLMKPQRISTGTTVRVPEHHRGAEGGGMVAGSQTVAGERGARDRGRSALAPTSSSATPSSHSEDLGPDRHARRPGVVGACYERFVRLPVAVVLALMWLVGAALLGSWALVLYALAASIASVVAGA